MKTTRNDAHPAHERLAALAAGDLAPREREALASHLEVCPVCREKVERLQRVWEDLPDRVGATAPLDLWPAVRARLHEERTVAFPAAPQPRWRIAVSFAAGLLIGIAAWSLATGGHGPTTAVAEELAVHEVLMSGLEPIPPESVGGIWLQMVDAQSIDPERQQ